MRELACLSRQYKPSVLWSCHIDTVHDAGGRQTVSLSAAGVVSLSKKSRKTSSCLGADDTAGIFLLYQMIRRGVPGHYIFHYGEERSGIGSRDLAETLPDFLTQFSCAIALDRRGTKDVITHQRYGRGCSDAFAQSLADGLGGALDYRLSSQGVYTDTAEYIHLIPECTNLSVGYEGAHGRGESLDTRHVFALLEALVKLDQSALVIARDPLDPDESWDSFLSPADALDDQGDHQFRWYNDHV